MTGTKKERPALNEMLKMLRPGDRVVVYKFNRISRSTKHLIELTELFEEKGVKNCFYFKIILILQHQWGAFSFGSWPVLLSWNVI